MSSTALHSLCQSLEMSCGISQTGTEDGEHYWLSLDQLPQKGFDTLNVDLLERLAEDFGESIDFQAGPKSTRPLLEEGTISSTADRDIRDLKSEGSIRTFKIEIDKKLLAEHRGLNGHGVRPVVYLFEEKLGRLLKSSLLTIDERLFEHHEERILVHPLDSDICCSGPMLSIVGPSYLEEVRSETVKTGRRMRERIEKYRTAIRQELNWTGFDLTCLTPLHLMLSRKDHEVEDQQGIATVLRRHLFDLCILFTADRCETTEDGHLQATFAGPDRTVEVALGSSRPIRSSGGELVRFARWPYLSEGGDRLAIFRDVVVRKLDGEDSSENYQQLDRRLDEILSSAAWHLRIFIEELIDEHFRQVRDAADYVATVVRDISERVNTLTSKLTTNLLATLGVVALSILPTLLRQGTVPEDVVTGALCVYATYLLLIPGLYQMSGLAHSQKLLTNEVENRKERLASRLGKQKIEEIMSPLKDRKKQFWIWFVITAVLYVSTAVLIYYVSPSPLDALTNVSARFTSLF